MKARRLSVLGLLLLLSSSGPAAAQEAGDPALATGFATLDRVGGQSNAGVAAGISLFDDALADFGILFDLYGQYSEVRDDVHVILTVGVQGNFPQDM